MVGKHLQRDNLGSLEWFSYINIKQLDNLRVTIKRKSKTNKYWSRKINGNVVIQKYFYFSVSSLKAHVHLSWEMMNLKTLNVMSVEESKGLINAEERYGERSRKRPEICTLFQFAFTSSVVT